MRQSKNHQPLVSVVIPVFNGSNFIGETVRSVQKNTYLNFEIILVDDGSTDKSQILCQRLAKKYENVRYFHFSQNKGMANALNLGVKTAKGKYIARLNQDDLIIADRLEKQVAFLEENPDYVAVGGAIQLFTDQKKLYDLVRFPQTDKAIRDQWLILSPFSDPTVMYRKSAWLKTTGYSQEFWPADDVHLWYRLGKLGKLANLGQVMTKVGWHKGVGSIKIHRLQIKKTWQIHHWAKRHVSRPSILIQMFWLIQYLAGMIFPPQFNWFVFRLLRKAQNFKLQFAAHYHPRSLRLAEPPQRRFAFEETTLPAV